LDESLSILQQYQAEPVIVFRGNPDLVDTLRVEPPPLLHTSFYVDGRSDSGAGLLSHACRSSDGGARSSPSTQGFAALGEADEADRCGSISVGPAVSVLDRLAVSYGQNIRAESQHKLLYRGVIEGRWPLWIPEQNLFE
jgi:hypothetical protein